MSPVVITPILSNKISIMILRIVISSMYVFLALLFSCKNESKSAVDMNQRSNVDIADEFIDAFYSFDGDTLKSILTNARESQASIIYYQKWTECGNYKVIDRNDYIIKNDSLIFYPITVKDDLIGALELDFNVTDTFHITVVKGKIKSVQTSSNDPDLYYEATEWVKHNRPELITKPCEGMWAGGTTACECVKAMVAGFREFKLSNQPKM